MYYDQYNMYYEQYNLYYEYITFIVKYIYYIYITARTNNNLLNIIKYYIVPDIYILVFIKIIKIKYTLQCSLQHSRYSHI